MTGMVIISMIMIMAFVQERETRDRVRVAIVDSATATAATLAELLSINALEAPGTTRGTAADPGKAGHSRPAETYGAPPTHIQMTTGDVARFTSIASRMFGEAFPDVTGIELADGG